MKKNVILGFFCVVFTFVLVSCGGKSSGDSAEVKNFLKDYDAFITEFCKNVDNLANADPMKKALGAIKIAQKVQKLQKYNSTMISIKASASKATQDKLEEMRKKAEECSKKLK